mmetsp:Transcript_147252/g.472974  ORF Transcript_147252/g.472974 Transcript_147252/m.472974 type:complete len:256 (+) Transcript_147252:208-975(+)
MSSLNPSQETSRSSSSVSEGSHSSGSKYAACSLERTSSPKTSTMSPRDTLPWPWMSKKSKTSRMAASPVSAEGRMVAANQSVYMILSSPSGSKASKAASNADFGNLMPLFAKACSIPSLDNQPAPCSSRVEKALLRSSTSRCRASCATMVRIAFSKREKCAKEPARPRMDLKACGDVLLLGALPPWKYACASASWALSRSSGSRCSNPKSRAFVDSGAATSLKGSKRTLCPWMFRKIWLTPTPDLAKGCWSVYTM